MVAGRRLVVALWLLGAVACALVIAQARFTSDMSAFLPRSPSAAQQVLVDQVQHGVVSRVILLALEGASPDALAKASRAMSERLRNEPLFAAINNGADGTFAQDRDFLWRNRYLLSPDVVAERFTAAGLRQSLEKDLALLGSDLGGLVKRSLPHDPTGEILTLVDQLAQGGRPHSRDGVWFSRDEHRALLMAETRAAGFDLDAQERALAQIDAAFDHAKEAVGEPGQMRLLKTGPAVFAVETRATMKEDVSRLSALAMVAVLGMLLLAYRSWRMVLLGFLPVVSGALAGIAAVALGFGFVHGITLGFGVTLIGESVDYAIYLLTQTEPGGSSEATLARIWPTLRLGVLTSIAGYGAMLFSGFAGFAQLGLFSIMGLIAAAAVTRWVLPVLRHRGSSSVGLGVFSAAWFGAAARNARQLRWLIILFTIAAIGLLLFHSGSFWQDDLSDLSPVPTADQQLDRALRHDIGAPDVRYLVVLSADGEEETLADSERLSQVMARLVAENALTGFDTPSRYLPSAAAQRARQAALPDAAILSERLNQALAGLAFRPELFAPFLADVAMAKVAPPITRDALPAGLSLKLDSLLFERHGSWVAVLPLYDVVAPQRIAEAIAAAAGRAVFVDLKAESDRLLQTYQREAAMLSLIGSLVILVLLAGSLRAPVRVSLVVAPLVVAVIVTTALITFGGRKFSIFDLVGLLLVVAVGSNYCLFFERRRRRDEARERVVASLVLANFCTVIGFGILSFSRIPVLHDIGRTVAIGALLSLVSAAILTAGRRTEPPEEHAAAAREGRR